MKFTFLSTLLAIALFSSCAKQPGPGGTATIKGKVFIERYNALGTLTSSYYAQDYDVFLIFGTDNETYDEDFSTSHDGTFEFKYLNKGNYKLFTYSDCSTCPNGQDSVVTREIEITERNQVLDLGDIIIYK